MLTSWGSQASKMSGRHLHRSRPSIATAWRAQRTEGRRPHKGPALLTRTGWATPGGGNGGRRRTEERKRRRMERERGRARRADEKSRKWRCVPSQPLPSHRHTDPATLWIGSGSLSGKAGRRATTRLTRCLQKEGVALTSGAIHKLRRDGASASGPLALKHPGLFTGQIHNGGSKARGPKVMSTPGKSTLDVHLLTTASDSACARCATVSYAHGAARTRQT